MKEALWVFMGSGLGGLLRYAIASLIPKNNSIPYATLLANAMACFFIGYAMGHIKLHTENSYIRYFLIIGLCGGLSTYSTYSYELFNQLLYKDIINFVLYTVLTFSICLGLTLSGYCLGK